MKTMRDHLYSLGAACVLALGVALAQDQAPQAPAPALPQTPGTAVSVKNAPVSVTNPAKRIPVIPRRPMPPPHNSSASVAPSVSAPPASAVGSLPMPEGSEPRSKTTAPSLKFDNTPVDIVLMAYAQETGKTLLPAPDVPKANITLKSQTDAPLTKEEYLEAIEAVLSMNGIVLEPFGDKFVKVLARKTVRTDGIRIQMDSPEGGYPEKSQVVSQMIQLKAITITEAQKALEGFKKADGLIQTFERTNSLLVTDTQENINRMLEIVKFIDQPLVATEEVNVRVVRFAKADDIKKRLEELVAESQKQTQAKEEVKANAAGAPGFTRSTTSSLTRPFPPGLSRLGAAAQPAVPTPNEVLETLVSDADRGMIRGKVQIISDERSNQLIIITRKENMDFFDRIISVLDIETAPDVGVEVQRLEFADAEEVSTMLNDLIGNASSKKDDKAPAGSAKGAAATPGEPAKSPTLAEAVAARTASRDTSSAGESGKTKLGALSKDNIKILADKRTNAIVMMGSRSDLAAIKEIIKGMDIKLSQVLIETVVIQVGLDDSLRTGVDWILGRQNDKYIINGSDRPPSTKQVDTGKDDADGNPIYETVVVPGHFSGDLFGGGGGGTSLGSLISGTNNAIEAAASMISPGVNYFLKSEKLNIAAMIKATESDAHAKVLSSPILMTVDNKEATLESTSMRYLYKGVRYSGSTQYGTEVPDYEQRDIGLTVKITPRINPNGSVILSIDETFETIGTPQKVGDDEYPTINTRKVQADIAVENMQTVVLGGLVQSEQNDSESGIPLLKDIPWVGKYLFASTSHSENRSELVVFITPYVLDTPEDLEAEAQRRKEVLHDARPWDDAGWSRSRIADPLSKKEMLEKSKRKWKAEDADRDAKKAMDEATRKREQTLKDRSKEDAEDELLRIKRESETVADEAEKAGEDPTEAQLRVLLTRLQDKQRAERAAKEPDRSGALPQEAVRSEPVIRVTDSVEILRKGEDNPTQTAAPEKQPERLLSEAPKP